MLLPNGDAAQVDREKITGYLLSGDHPDGRNKARFFNRFGFHIENWEILAQSLRNHGAICPVVKAVESEFGTRYTVEGHIETPDNRRPKIRTIWLIEKGNQTPRLITAFPC